MNLQNKRYCGKMWRISTCLVLVNYICASASSTDGETSFTIYETPENIRSHGYPAERHHVITEDGYILEMHRIPGKKGETPTASTGRPVVFLMHGLLSASSAFIGLGPENSIAYNLADAGFDVWMANARGTRNSRNHTTLDPDDEIEKFPFFDFSFEEIGTKDIPAMVDYALTVTGQSQLHYIGHSQGGTVFLILNSMDPEYSIKFKSAHLLAPSGYQKYTPPGPLDSLTQNIDLIYALALSQGIVELYPGNLSRAALNTEVVEEGTSLCSGTATYTQICRMMNIEDILGGLFNDTRPPGFHIGGAATKQVAHYGQNIRDKAFRRWNYGSQNPDIYGQADPPIYNLNLIVTNTVLHYTVSDNLIDERDILAMAADMPNAKVRRVSRESFLHSDFTQAEDSRELVTNYIIDAIWSVETPDDRSHGSTIVLSTLLKVYFVFYILRTFLR